MIYLDFIIVPKSLLKLIYNTRLSITFDYLKFTIEKIEF